MAVESVIESFEQTEGELNTQEARASRFYDVVFDGSEEPSHREFLACLANDGSKAVPRVGSRHPYSPWVYVTGVRARQKTGPMNWMVEVIYSTRPVQSGEEIINPFVNPLDQPWEVEWTFVTSNEAIDRDVNGKPIMNSAGESFDPPITKDIQDLVLRVVRNEAYYNAAVAADYIGSINRDWFKGFAPGMVRCTDCSGRLMRSANMVYWQVSYEFQMRTEKDSETNEVIGWRRRILDQGFRELVKQDDETYKAERITDVNGNPISEPWPLDGKGAAIGEPIPGQVPEGTTFLTFDIYPAQSFANLGL